VGSVINLIVNKPTQAYAPAAIDTRNRINLFRYRLDNGFLKKQIRIRLDSMGVSSILFNDLVRPGEEIWLLIPKQDNATVFLYEDDELIRTKIY
jgi:serine/threonine-protein kinase